MNDKTELVKEEKTTKQVVVVGPPIKKRLGEMLPNQKYTFIPTNFCQSYPTCYTKDFCTYVTCALCLCSFLDMLSML